LKFCEFTYSDDNFPHVHHVPKKVVHQTHGDNFVNS